MSNKNHDMARWLEELPEPDPFGPEEFDAWRGLIRLREAVTREIDHRLREDGELSLADYGVLITLVTAPGLRLRMGSLGTQRMLTPSGITRVVNDLEKRGLVSLAKPARENVRITLAAGASQGTPTMQTGVIGPRITVP